VDRGAADAAAGAVYAARVTSVTFRGVAWSAPYATGRPPRRSHDSAVASLETTRDTTQRRYHRTEGNRQFWRFCRSGRTGPHRHWDAAGDGSNREAGIPASRE